jgi:hypothetical protein
MPPAANPVHSRASCSKATPSLWHTHDDYDEERQTNLKMIGGYSSEREAEQQELANISIRILRHA